MNCYMDPGRASRGLKGSVLFVDNNKRQCAIMWALCEHQPYCLSAAWCLRNEGVSSVLLGTSNPEQLTENLGAIQVGSKSYIWFASYIRGSFFSPDKLNSALSVQVLPKMTSHIVSDIDHILGNRPYSKKDYRS